MKITSISNFLFTYRFVMIVVLAVSLLITGVSIVSAETSSDAYQYILQSDGLVLRGDRGPAVEDLQEALNDLGMYNGVINGRFGPRTEKAVQSFQKSQELVADGIVGNGTRAALLEALFPGRTSPFTAIVAGEIAEDSCEPITEMPVCSLTSGVLVCSESYQKLVTLDEQTDEQSVVVVDLDKAAAVSLQITLKETQGWTLHMADTKEADGWGSDTGTELQVHDGLLSVFGNGTEKRGLDGSLLHQEKLTPGDTVLHLELQPGKITYWFDDNKIAKQEILGSGLFSQVASTRKLYVGLNRVIAGGNRTGTGAELSRLQLVSDDGQIFGATYTFSDDCLLSVEEDIAQLAGTSLVTDQNICSFMPATGAWECRNNSLELLAKDTSRQSGLIGVNGESVRIEFQLDPGMRQWSLNIGDSKTNNGWGGDAGTDQYDAEIQVYNGLLSVFRREDAVFLAGLPHMAKSESLPKQIIDGGGSLVITIKPGEVSYEVFDKTGKSVLDTIIRDEYLFALGQSDDIEAQPLFIGVNQVVSGSRFGSGIQMVTLETPAR